MPSLRTQDQEGFSQSMLQRENIDRRASGPEFAREFKFTEADYIAIRDLLKSRSGIHLAESKKNLAYGRIAKIVRRRGLTRIGEYVDLVRSGDPAINTEFLNALTTNVTSFFREPGQFVYLKEEFFPELLESNKQSRKIRIWSSACSTGQEPYSIAMVMHESIPKSAGFDARILATDLDSDVLAHARQGLYSDESIATMDPARLRMFFRRGRGVNLGDNRVSPELQEYISFLQLNLMESWPMRGSFDAIFCRNVVIYFTEETQRILFDRMADLLGVGKCLFLGHSESLMGMSDRFEFCGKNVYRKVK